MEEEKKHIIEENVPATQNRSSDLKEDLNNPDQAPQSIQKSQERQTKTEKKESGVYECSRGCWKKWIVITILYIIFYGFNLLYFWLLMWASTKNTLACIIAYSVVFIVTVTIIWGSIWYGTATSLRDKAVFTQMSHNTERDIDDTERSED